MAANPGISRCPRAQAISGPGQSRAPRDTPVPGCPGHIRACPGPGMPRARGNTLEGLAQRSKDAKQCAISLPGRWKYRESSRCVWPLWRRCSTRTATSFLRSIASTSQGFDFGSPIGIVRVGSGEKGERKWDQLRLPGPHAIPIIPHQSPDIPHHPPPTL